MRTKSLIFLLSGIVIGWAGHYFSNLSQDKSMAENTKTRVHSDVSAPKEEQKMQSLIITATGTPSSKSSRTNTQEPNQNTTSQENDSGDLSRTTTQCLAQLKPSDIDRWRTLWNQKVNEFVINNSVLWKTGESGSMDLQALQSTLGQYKGRIQAGFDPNSETELEIQIDGDRGAVGIKIKTPTTQGYSTSTCKTTLQSKKDFGFDSNSHALNVLLPNCISGEWSKFSYLAFKLPIGLEIGKTTRLDMYALSEELNWLTIGSIELSRSKR